MFRLRGKGGRGADAPTAPSALPVAPEMVPAPTPPRGEWRGLAVQRATFGAPELLTAPDAFAAGLGTWQNPSLSGELGHAVTPTAPAGLISDVAEIAPLAAEAAPGVAEFVPRASPTGSADLVPVRPSTREPQLTVARGADLDLPVRPLAAVGDGGRPASPEPELPSVQRSAAAPLVGELPPLSGTGELPGTSVERAADPGPAPDPAPAPNRGRAPDSGPAPARPLGLGAPLPSVPPVVQRVRPEGATPRPGYVGEPLSAVPAPVRPAPGTPVVQRRAADSTPGDVPAPSAPRWGMQPSADASADDLPRPSGAAVAPLLGDAVPLVQRQVADGGTPDQRVPGGFDSSAPDLSGGLAHGVQSSAGSSPSAGGSRDAVPLVQRLAADGGTPDQRVPGGPDGSVVDSPSAAPVAPLLGDSVPLVQRQAADGGADSVTGAPVQRDPGGSVGDISPLPAAGSGGQVAPPVQRLVADGSAGSAPPSAPPVRRAPESVSAAPASPGPAVQRSADPSPSGDGVALLLGDAVPLVQRQVSGAPVPRSVDVAGGDVPPPPEPSVGSAGPVAPLVQRLADSVSVPVVRLDPPAPADSVDRELAGGRTAVQRVGLLGERGLELRAAATPREPERQAVAPAVVPVEWRRPHGQADPDVAPPVQRQAERPLTRPDAVPVVQRTVQSAAEETTAPPAAGDLALAAGIASREPDGSFVFAPPAPPVSVQREPDAPDPAPAPAPQPAAPAPATTPAAPQATAENTDELVRRLLAPLTRLLRAELRLDRERAGLRLDSRH